MPPEAPVNGRSAERTDTPALRRSRNLEVLKGGEIIRSFHRSEEDRAERELAAMDLTNGGDVITYFSGQSMGGKLTLLETRTPLAENGDQTLLDPGELAWALDWNANCEAEAENSADGGRRGEQVLLRFALTSRVEIKRFEFGSSFSLQGARGME